MTVLSTKAARQQFSTLISNVTRGQSVTITRRGKPVALVSPVPSKKRPRFPDLSDFRAKMKKPGTPETTIVDLRNAERY
jgi:prevent-host-death family protein